METDSKLVQHSNRVIFQTALKILSLMPDDIFLFHQFYIPFGELKTIIRGSNTTNS